MTQTGNIFNEAFQNLHDEFGFKHRDFPSFKFGNQNECKNFIEEGFLLIDKTISDFIFTPELEELAIWMTDTKGKGLLLSGDVGRGKSNIVMLFIPLIFYHFHNKVVNVVQAEELASNFKNLRTKQFISVDDLGTETFKNDFGEKYEPINKLINIAESEGKILFISTNLNSNEVMERYGLRTFDRINRLCYIIKFTGDSMRK